MSGTYKPFFPHGRKAQGDRAGRDVSAVSTPVAGVGAIGNTQKTAEISHFPTVPEGTVSTVSTVSGFPLPWADGLAVMERMDAPDWMREDQWDHIVRTALGLSRDWGVQALAMGWDTLDLFGCNPEPWAGRIDRDGLSLSLSGWRGPITVRAITATAITMEADHGQVVRFYRHQRSGAVPMWVAYGRGGGP